MTRKVARKGSSIDLLNVREPIAIRIQIFNGRKAVTIIRISGAVLVGGKRTQTIVTERTVINRLPNCRGVRSFKTNKVRA